mmetsp:Transcript_2559/g.4232  ORF Transcript_2559/g.4232 Transcript_2559/m.4232 type:complete len:212 (-) Transcript_2559:279-914(-)
MSSGGGLGGAIPPRKVFEPPPKWPTPLHKPVEPEPINEKRRAEVDLEIVRSRLYVEKMKRHALRLRVPDKRVKVMTYQDATMEQERSGCTLLKHNLLRPLSHLYFPIELIDAITPAMDKLTGEYMGLSKNAISGQFRNKTNAPTSQTLARLARLEAKTDAGVLESRRKNSIDSQDGDEEEEEEEDEGDYGEQYYDDDDEEEDIDEDEEATM